MAPGFAPSLSASSCSITVSTRLPREPFRSAFFNSASSSGSPAATTSTSPVVGIPNPAAQANLRRLPLHKPAKPNALHAAFHEIMAHHGTFSVAERPYPRKARRPKQRQSRWTLPHRLPE